MTGASCLRTLWTSGLLCWRLHGGRGFHDHKLIGYLLYARRSGCKVSGRSPFVLRVYLPRKDHHAILRNDADVPVFECGVMVELGLDFFGNRLVIVRAAAVACARGKSGGYQNARCQGIACFHSLALSARMSLGGKLRNQ